MSHKLPGPPTTALITEQGGKGAYLNSPLKSPLGGHMGLIVWQVEIQKVDKKYICVHLPHC